jgi:hypothetical protein
VVLTGGERSVAPPLVTALTHLLKKKKDTPSAHKPNDHNPATTNKQTNKQPNNRRSAPHLFLQLALLSLLAHNARSEWSWGQRWARDGNLGFAAVLAGAWK